MTCKRFDEEGLLLLERGAALGEHYDECPECLAQRRLHERMLATMAAPSADDDHVPPAWEQRLRAALAREMEAMTPAPAPPPVAPQTMRPPRPWAPWRWASLGALATAATTTAWMLVSPLLRAPLPPSLAWTVAAASPLRRSAEVQRGSTLRFEATTGGHAVSEIRVYRDDDKQPVLACSAEAPCRRDGERLVAEWRVDGYGLYRVRLLVSRRPIPPPGQGYDRDTAAALDAGAEIIKAAAPADREAGAEIEAGQATFEVR